MGSHEFLKGRNSGVFSIKLKYFARLFYLSILLSAAHLLEFSDLAENSLKWNTFFRLLDSFKYAVKAEKVFPFPLNRKTLFPTLASVSRRPIV